MGKEDENSNGKINEGQDASLSVQSGAFSNRREKWLSSGAGGLVGAIGTLLVIVIPVINTWLENTKQIQLQQLKNNAEQIEYITKRMQDSDKERDLYRAEMNNAMQDLRACRLELSKVGK